MAKPSPSPSPSSPSPSSPSPSSPSSPSPSPSSTTRLDKLVNLLCGEGVSPATRSVAASQLGEIQRQFPGQLASLVSRVYPLFKSDDWQTRTAAGQALSAIIQEVPQWDPDSIRLPMNVERKDVNEDYTDWLRFDMFDMERVLKRGKPLLGSGGSEFDDDSFVGMDAKQRLALQRKNLKKQLGLLDDTVTNLITEADVVAPSSVPIMRTAAVVSSEEQDILDALKTSGLSARERYQKKRQLKEIQRKKKVESASQVRESTIEDANEHVVAMSSSSSLSRTPGSSSTSSGWPFEELFLEFCFDLFNPKWTIRHGGALGIREILACHGNGVGKVIGATIESNRKRHEAFIDDISLRVLCVFALDRYGDYSGDSVVAPVREMCAQALGALLHHVSSKSVSCSVDTLLRMNSHPEWEVRHGCLLGLKYIVAVRADLSGDLLPRMLPTISVALGDDDDDVRAVAAEALLPVVSQVVEYYNEEKEKLSAMLGRLWDSLSVMSMLSPATGAVMKLLSSLYTYESMPSFGELPLDGSGVGADEKTKKDDSTVFSMLYSRLFRFLRHPLVSVRSAVFQTLVVLIACPTTPPSPRNWLWPILDRVFPALFGVLVCEEDEKILEKCLTLWCRLVVGRGKADDDDDVGLLKEEEEGATTDDRISIIRKATCPQIEKFVKILGTRLGDRVEMSLNEGEQDSEEGIASPTPKKSSPSSPHSLSTEFTSNNLDASRKALGSLLSLWPVTSMKCDDNNGELFPISLFTSNISSCDHSLARNTAVLMESWILESFKRVSSSSSLTPAPQEYYPPTNKLFSILANSNIPNPDRPPVWNEHLTLFWEVQRECRKYVAMGGGGGGGVSLDGTTTLTLSKILSIAETPLSNNNDTTKKQQLNAIRLSLKNSSDILFSQNSACDVSYYGAIARAYIASIVKHPSPTFTLPPKMNPVLRAIMNAVRFEENRSLQAGAAHALSSLLLRIAIEIPPPLPVIASKIIRNLCAVVVSDRSIVPVANEPARSPQEMVMGLETSSDNSNSNNSGSEKDIRARNGAIFVFEGIASALTHSSSSFSSSNNGSNNSSVFALLPVLWEVVSVPLVKWTNDDGSCCAMIVDDNQKHDDEMMKRNQSIIDALVIGISLFPILPTVDCERMLSLLKAVCGILVGFANESIRQCCAKWLGIAASSNPIPVFEDAILARILPSLSSSSEFARIGASETIFALVELLELSIVPFLSFLVVPVLSRMSDQCERVRSTLARTFGTIMKLLPLEASNGNNNVKLPPSAKNQRQEITLPPHLQAKRETERHFLEQLLDQSKVDKYEIKVPISGTLRPYQQDGVNWLGFLNKYHLHGILCDDMGLGKTLQALAMLLSDYVAREEKHASKMTDEYDLDDVPLPSLIICPPTIVPHWYDEVYKFFDSSIPVVMYTGNKTARSLLAKKLKSARIIIASYDIVRNDIAVFTSLRFNYCILDEGHLIRNPRAQVTLGVKRIVSNCRLILTGTPIQNNVLELWSLFDFLMPGFLGTEKQFNAVYSKPILASKDPKANNQVQEAGTWALEALHRQVLPFLMRRLKEDVLDDLPPKIISDYPVKLSPVQAALYEAFSAAGIKRNVAKEIDRDVREKEEDKEAVVTKERPPAPPPPAAIHVFQALQFLRKLVNHPLLALASPPSESFNEDMMNDVVSSFVTQEEELHDLEHAPKLVGLQQLLLECGIGTMSSDDKQRSSDATATAGHRVLIFSQQKSMLDLIAKDLFDSYMPSVAYRRLDGSVDALARQRVVNEFNNNPTIDVLLLTTRVGGLGLNLTGADTVCFMDHDWNPMADLQAMDRCHRIGQKKVVNVYRFITIGTLEEKIMSLQRFKKNIAETVVNRDNASLRTMSTEQLLDLFTFSTSDERKPASSKNPTNGGVTVGATGEVEVSKRGKKRKSGKVQALLDSLEDLWDSKQYEDEYDVNSFVSRLQQS